MRALKLYGKLATTVTAAALFGGCATAPSTDRYRATMPPAYSAAETHDGSIYHAARDVRLFEDVKARRIGDVITVVLKESTSASKSATTTADKDQDTSVANPTFFGASPQFNLPGLLPLSSNKNNSLEQNLSATRAFKGEADASQSNSLSGAITVTIADVLPNGNLVVRGEKWLTLNQGQEYIQISGIVRPQDISPDNSVLSTQIGDARITYSGKGFLHDSNNMGWLARFFNSPLWPF
jgi:flagellar L-ring protein precursor FlgH